LQGNVGNGRLRDLNIGSEVEPQFNL
jgi:hypothetical protein